MRLLSFVMLGALGCGKSHVHIPTSPAQLTLEQRVAAFQQYRRSGDGVEISTSCGAVGCSTHATDLMMLRDGTKIRYAEDLLPLLPPNSPAAADAREIESARRTSKRRHELGYLMFIGGFIVSMIGFDKKSDPLMYGGLATAAGGLTLLIHTSFTYDVEIQQKTRIVFDSYDQSLATRFDMCINGLAVVPCEQSVPGVPPPVGEPDPALRELRQK